MSARDLSTLAPGILAPTRPARDRPRYLMSRRQPLAVLPTLWFWEEIRGRSLAVDLSIGLFMGFFTLGLINLVLLVELALLPALVLTVLAPYLALGALERVLRHLVLLRRRQFARGGAGRALLASIAE